MLLADFLINGKNNDFLAQRADYKDRTYVISAD
jgi:hypothetical protein